MVCPFFVVVVRDDPCSAAQPHIRPERPTASPLGSRRASRAGARSM